jgi:hypothetical protein
VGEGALARAVQSLRVTFHADFSDRHRRKAVFSPMNLDTKVPPPPRLPKGLIALARASHVPPASTPRGAELRAAREPEESTRAWKPDRSLLQPDPQPAKASDFALAADEQTMVGRVNLNDPSLFRSEPPAALMQDAKNEWAADEETMIEFVGSLTDPNLDEAQPAPASIWGDGDEKTRLYKPQRSHLSPEEPTDEFEAAVPAGETAGVGAGPPKVIIAAAVLADSAPDPARAEATKRRRGRRTADTKLGLSLCLLGALALALSVAWRHPRTAPATHHAFAKIAAVVSSLRGK